MNNLQRAQKVLPLVRRFLRAGAEKANANSRGKRMTRSALWDYLYNDLANLRMWLRDSSGFILRVERAQRTRHAAHSILLQENLLDHTYKLEVWIQDMPKADNPLPVTDKPGPSASHYGYGVVAQGAYDTVTYLKRARDQGQHAIGERVLRMKEDEE